jgi:hypothetical protein
MLNISDLYYKTAEDNNQLRKLNLKYRNKILDLNSEIKRLNKLINTNENLNLNNSTKTDNKSSIEKIVTDESLPR